MGTTMGDTLNALVPATIAKDPTSFSEKSITRSIAYYGLESIDPVKHNRLVDTAVAVADEIVTLVGPGLSDGDAAIKALLEHPQVKQLLFAVSRLPVFSDEMAAAFKDNLIVLGMLKQIKYFHALPMSTFAIALARLTEARLGGGTTDKPYSAFVEAVIESPNGQRRLDRVSRSLTAEIRAGIKVMLITSNRQTHMQSTQPASSASATAVPTPLPMLLSLRRLCQHLSLQPSA